MTLAELTDFISAAFSGILRVITENSLGGFPLVLWFVAFWIIGTLVGMIFDTDVPEWVVEGSHFTRYRSKGRRRK